LRTPETQCPSWFTAPGPAGVARAKMHRVSPNGSRGEESPITRYELSDGPRRRVPKWIPDLLSDPMEKLAAILAAHFATMNAEERAARLAATRPMLKAGRPFRGRTVPGCPCTRTKPDGVACWEEWRMVPGVAGHF
jgi:hypothetical protein